MTITMTITMTIALAMAMSQLGWIRVGLDTQTMSTTTTDIWTS